MSTPQTLPIKPITLHALDFWGAPNPRKIAIALELLHIPYEVKLWQFGNAENGLAGSIFSKTINPAERVPVIHDPNTGIDAFESAAIINYLTRTYDKGSKLSVSEEDTEQERVDAEAWTHFLVSGLGTQTSNLHFFKKHGEAGALGAKRFEALMRASWGVFEGRLKEFGGWVLRRGFSAVDVHFYAWIRAGVEMDGMVLADFPAIKGWFESVDGMEEVKRAYEKVKDGMRM